MIFLVFLLEKPILLTLSAHMVQVLAHMVQGTTSKCPQSEPKVTQSNPKVAQKYCELAEFPSEVLAEFPSEVASHKLLISAGKTALRAAEFPPRPFKFIKLKG